MSGESGPGETPDPWSRPQDGEPDPTSVIPEADPAAPEPRAAEPPAPEARAPEPDAPGSQPAGSGQAAFAPIEPFAAPEPFPASSYDRPANPPPGETASLAGFDPPGTGPYPAGPYPAAPYPAAAQPPYPAPSPYPAASPYPPPGQPPYPPAADPPYPAQYPYPPQYPPSGQQYPSAPPYPGVPAYHPSSAAAAAVYHLDAYGMPVPTQTEPLAIAALVTGATSLTLTLLACCCAPLLIVTGLGGIGGIILGVLGKRNTTAKGTAGSGMAIAGIVTGASALVLALVGAILVAALGLSAGFGSFPGTTS
ncbi:MAG: hypothetical protein JWO79_4360 [Actinomycetia bacterium]|nr:hypothetical protein [Actinomycetes bacterium]